MNIPYSVGPGAARRGARGRPRHPRKGMGVTPDWYGGHPGLVWGAPRTKMKKNQDNMLKKRCMSKIQKMFRYLSHDLQYWYIYIYIYWYIYISVYIYIFAYIFAYIFETLSFLSEGFLWVCRGVSDGMHYYDEYYTNMAAAYAAC